MKKESKLSKLMEYADGHRYLTYISWVLAAASAIVTLVPFWYIWRILKEIIEVAPDFDKATQVIENGWMAVAFAVLALVTYMGALFCSHLAAFRVATNIRLKLTKHITTLPLGEIEVFGSGHLRRIITQASAATETYLAHQLPDQAKACGTVVGLLVLLFIFDWRLGLLCLLPMVLGFLSMMTMMDKGMQQKMKEYQNALNDMSNEAVEYVRGIPVVKTFGQTVFSFKRFKDSIDRYSTWAIAYTKELRTPMMLYTLAINSVFVFFVVAGFLWSGESVSNEFLLNMIFYIILSPVISLVLSKMMHQAKNEMTVGDALERIASVLVLQPLSSTNSAHPKDSSVELKSVTFSYDGSKNALEKLSLIHI